MVVFTVRKLVTMQENALIKMIKTIALKVRTIKVGMVTEGRMIEMTTIIIAGMEEVEVEVDLIEGEDHTQDLVHTHQDREILTIDQEGMSQKDIKDLVLVLILMVYGFIT